MRDRQLRKIASEIPNTANLLRHSRIASIVTPRPEIHASETIGKAPYPVNQAICAPASSRSRGDFGLKRTFPTRMKSEYIRYNDIDTPEHRATFESAHDHVLTVKKWQEMDIPLAKAVDEILYHGARVSAYTYDSEKAPESIRVLWGQKQPPYLPDMSWAEIKEYVKTEFAPRQEQFLRFVLYKQIRAIREENARRRAAEESGEGEVQPQIDIPEGDISLLDLRSLYENKNLLKQYIAEYFKIDMVNKPYITHPGAGLHYIKNRGLMRNDPLDGPVTEYAIVPGRMYMRPFSNQTLMGLVGGVVADARQFIGNTGGFANPGKTSQKVMIWNIKDAKIIENGRIHMEVFPAQPHKGDWRTSGATTSYGRTRVAIPGEAASRNIDTAQMKETAKLEDQMSQLMNAGEGNADRPGGMAGGRQGMFERRQKAPREGQMSMNNQISNVLKILEPYERQ